MPGNSASCSLRLFGILLVALGTSVVLAFSHEILDAERAAEYLAAIAQAHQESQAGKTQDERLEALYNLGIRAFQLAKLMNQDFQAHGVSDPKLLTLIFRRLQPYGVTIRKVEDGYVYDFAPFREYLRLAPTGKLAAAAHLVLIRYEEVPDNQARLEKAIHEKVEFLRKFPAHSSVPYVKLELARDHVRLSRLLRFERLLGDPNKAALGEQHEQAAADLLRELTLRYSDSDEAEEARDMLASLRSRKGEPRKP